MGAAFLDFAQGGEQVWRRDGRYRPFAQSRKDQLLEGPLGFLERGGREFLFLQCQPFAGDGLEGVGARGFLGLALGAGIDTPRNELACFLAALAREPQRYIGIDAKRE